MKLKEKGIEKKRGVYFPFLPPGQKKNGDDYIDLNNFCFCFSRIQSDQLNMAVFIWYLNKSDLSSIHMYSSVHWTSRLLQ